MKYIAIALSGIIYSSVYASGCPVQGNPAMPIPPLGYTQTSLKPHPADKSKELIELSPTKGNIHGVKQSWIITRNNKGQIINLTSGGSIPSKDHLKYINDVKAQELILSAKVADKNSGFYNFRDPEDFPVKVGASIDLEYSNDECFVSEVNEQYFDQKSKTVKDSAIYKESQCQEITALHNKLEKGIMECEQKIENYAFLISKTLSSKDVGTYQGGIGGGGSQPLTERSIASINEETQPFDPKIFLSNPTLKNAYKAKELCDLIAPTRTAKSSEGSQVKGSKVNKQ